MQGTNNMTPEKKSSNINLEAIGHSGDLEGNLQEDHYDKENASSVQEFKDLDTDQIRQVAPVPESSGVLILTPAEQPAFKEKYSALVESHKPTESHTRRNVTIGAASLLLVGGAIGGVTALNNQPSNTPPETEPSATGSPIAGETQAPAPTNTVESPLASPTNLGPLETAKPTPSASEVAPGTLNEFGITAIEYEKVEKSLTIDANVHKTPTEVTNAFTNVINNYYAGGHSAEIRDAHYDDTTPNGKVGWNAWSNELYTKAITESLFIPGYAERSDSAIPNLENNKREVNRLWVNSLKAGEEKYTMTTSFSIDNISNVTENSFTVTGTSYQLDNSADIPSAASDSARIIGTQETENVEITFVKHGEQWHVVSYAIVS